MKPQTQAHHALARAVPIPRARTSDGARHRDSAPAEGFDV